MIELDGPQLNDRLVQPLPALAQQSLTTRGESWTAGAPADQQLV